MNSRLNLFLLGGGGVRCNSRVVRFCTGSECNSVTYLRCAALRYTFSRGFPCIRLIIHQIDDYLVREAPLFNTTISYPSSIVIYHSDACMASVSIRPHTQQAIDHKRRRGEGGVLPSFLFELTLTRCSIAADISSTDSRLLSRARLIDDLAKRKSPSFFFHFFICVFIVVRGVVCDYTTVMNNPLYERVKKKKASDRAYVCVCVAS